MPDANETPKGALGRFLALPADSVPKTIFIAVTLCLVASMAVSAVAVSLRPAQEVNKLRDKQVNILQVAGVYEKGGDVTAAFQAFEQRILNVETGEFTDEFDLATFEDRAVADDPATSIELDNDPASIGRRGNFVTVYILRDEAGGVDKVVLPIHGYGLWSTLYGFIALEENGNDVFGLQFYEHGETPGLGAEVDNPKWKALWNGKRLRDEDGDLAITVAKSMPPEGEDYYVEGLSGATLTSNGVDSLVKFWMGETGYEPFLQRLRAGEV